jgi:hypothetical protein
MMYLRYDSVIVLCRLDVQWTEANLPEVRKSVVAVGRFIFVFTHIVRDLPHSAMTDTPPSTLFDDPNASHPLDLLINAIHGEGEYEIPPEARDGHGGFNLEQLLGQESSTTEEPNRVCRSLDSFLPKLIDRTRERGANHLSTRRMRRRPNSYRRI